MVETVRSERSAMLDPTESASRTVGDAAPTADSFRPILIDLSEIFRAAGISPRGKGELTELGIHLVTPARIFYEGLGMLTGNPPKRITEAGSGQGETAIRFAHRFPECTVTGFEYDPIIYAESVKLVAAAERAGLVRPGQVTLKQGDFNKGFDRDFFDADLVYYYSQGSAAPEQFADTLARTTAHRVQILETGLISQLGRHLPAACARHSREFVTTQSEARPYLRLHVLSHVHVIDLVHHPEWHQP